MVRRRSQAEVNGICRKELARLGLQAVSTSGYLRACLGYSRGCSCSCGCTTLFTFDPWSNFGDIAGPPLARFAARHGDTSVCEIRRDDLDQPWIRNARPIGTESVVIGLGSVLQQLAECMPSWRCEGNTCYSQRKSACPLNETRFGALTSGIRRSQLVLWGSGILGPSRPRAHALLGKLASSGARLDARAVRGPLTLDFLRRVGLVAGDEATATRAKATVLGDPALLLPAMFPRCHRQCTPTRAVCVVPHRKDEVELLTNSSKGVRLSAAIALPPSLTRADVEVREVSTPFAEMLEWILGCKLVVSSSLHGLIFADAFGVPSRWLRLEGRGSARSEGWTKYIDYYAATRPHILSAYRSIAPRLNRPAVIEPLAERTRLLGDCIPASSVAEAFALGGAAPIRHFDTNALLSAFPTAARCKVAGPGGGGDTAVDVAVGATRGCHTIVSRNCTGWIVSR